VSAGPVILALAAQATLIAVIFTAVIVCAARREHHARTLSQGLSAARPKLRDLLADPEARGEGALAIACLPVELRIALFSEFAGTLLGEERERLASLAQTTGLTAHAEARCRSRRWWLRLQGVRLLTLIGSNQEFLPVLLEDSDPEPKHMARLPTGRGAALARRMGGPHSPQRRTSRIAHHMRVHDGLATSRLHAAGHEHRASHPTATPRHDHLRACG
jgi:hypothetical protein